MALSGNDFRTLFGLSRPVNLLIAQLSFGYAAFLSARGWDFARHPLYWAEAALLLFIMAGGYWINDVYDRRTDATNRPARRFISRVISAKKVLSVYLASTAICALASLLLPPKFLLINLAAMGLLWLYSARLKPRPLVGNLVVATLTALVVFAGAWLADPLQERLFWLMGFAFWATLAREVVKDAQDIPGDLKHGMRTLPIVLGLRSTRLFVAGLYLVLVLACNAPWLVHGLGYGNWLPKYAFFSLLLVQGPVVVNWVFLAQAQHPADFARQSLVLKLVLLPGMFSCWWLP